MPLGAITDDLTLDRVVTALRLNEMALRARGITSMAVFGSRVRGDHRPDSDLDLLIDVDPLQKFSLIDLSSAQFFLEDLIGCRVQLTLRVGLKAAVAASVAHDAVSIF
jgi:uncharacterized protein